MISFLHITLSKLSFVIMSHSFHPFIYTWSNNDLYRYDTD